MSYAQQIRDKLNPGSSEDVRAVIYARVSTDNDSQKDSCANQIALAENYISQHQNVRLIGTFVDDGISGKNDFTRPQYNAMLQTISEGQVDLIITKALSRLNRDQLNSLYLNSLLVEHETTILTLEDGQIHDFEDENSDLLHSIKYVLDAQFVKQQSLNGRKFQEVRCLNKLLCQKDKSFGYDWNKEEKTISVNEEQAEVVRWIFEEYVYRNGTAASIMRILEQKGVSICDRSVSNILKDERYIGRFYINKRTSKLGTGKNKSRRIKLPKEQWVRIDRPDLQIIDPVLFEMAQRVHETRVSTFNKPGKPSAQARFAGIHTFAGKVFCPVCRKAYQFDYADRKKEIPVYRIKSHKACRNHNYKIWAADLEEATRQALKRIMDQQDNIYSSLEQVLYECVEASQEADADLPKLKQQKTAKENKIESLIDALSEGGLTAAARERIKSRINQITEDQARLAEVIRNKEDSRLDDSFVTDKIAEIKAAITELRNFSTIDRERILNYIDRIEIPESGDIEITLTSGHIITTGDQNNHDFSERPSVGKLRIQDMTGP